MAVARRFAAVAAALFWATAAAAQGVWVQLEAHRDLAEAEARAARYAERFPEVEGYRLGSGWYAVTLGPYDPALAEAELVRLRAQGAIPGDAYLADGSTFDERFWPLGPAGLAPAALGPDAAGTPDASAPPPADETEAEARAGERRLSRDEREALQRALAAAGFYDARIDGDFGPGTRRAMAAWQAATGHRATGVMTTGQRRALQDSVRAARQRLGLEPVTDDRAGIEIVLPSAAVAFDAYQAPFARYAGTGAVAGAQVLLISQAGDAATLRGLYDVMQTLEIVPPDGPRRFGRTRFTLAGNDGEIASYTYAALADGAVKGFTLVWPADDMLGRQIALRAMQESFAPVDGTVLPDDAGLAALQRPDLLAGLQIRRPRVPASGFYVDRSGAVLTGAGPVAECGRITLDGEVAAKLAASEPALGLALLRPQEPLAPLAVGRLSAATPRLGDEIAVAGYSHGGLLGAPTMSYGRLQDLRGLDGSDRVARLALSARPGDAGGPVLDATGAVLGMLLPRAEATGRDLPEDVRFAADAAAIAAFLAEAGVEMVSAAPSGTLDPTALTARGADMTVLVECWE